MSDRERSREPARSGADPRAEDADGADRAEGSAPRDFIREIVRADVAAGHNGGRVTTRWPPEPNGFMHIGHVKAVHLNFQVAREHGGVFNLRFDDTNPTAEEQRFVDAICEDVRWIGCDWGENLYFASDYFEQLYEFACRLVRQGQAFVCELDAEQLRESRGTLTEPGRPSPWRDRPMAENLDLFERMRAGEFHDGSRVLRAKIDMASPNINMRDPVLYRIQRASHYRTGSEWVVYPTYDFQHCLSDAIEGITHSLCTLEFEDHRPLYDWIVQAVGAECHPKQIEFAKFNLSYAVLGKRHLRRLVAEEHVLGWDDPRMPTVAGMRRRGYPAGAITACIESVGVAKRANSIDPAQLEHAVRDELNRTAPRAMGVLDPLRVVIENYPEDATEEVEAINNPEDAAMGTRRLPFSRLLYIERDDFREDPPRKYFRLAPGREVRLRYAYFVTCVGVVKDDAGQVTEVRCTYDPETRGGDAPDGRRVKGTLHWLSQAHARRATVRLYDRLFTVPDPMDVSEGGDFVDHLNPASLEERNDCWIEPALADAPHGQRLQLERLGYFSVDRDSTADRPVLNRIVPLRDSWAKLQKKT